jgi:hypothetical protein
MGEYDTPSDTLLGALPLLTNAVLGTTVVAVTTLAVIDAETGAKPGSPPPVAGSPAAATAAAAVLFAATASPSLTGSGTVPLYTAFVTGAALCQTYTDSTLECQVNFTQGAIDGTNDCRMLYGYDSTGAGTSAATASKKYGSFSSPASAAGLILTMPPPVGVIEVARPVAALTNKTLYDFRVTWTRMNLADAVLAASAKDIAGVYTCCVSDYMQPESIHLLLSENGVLEEFALPPDTNAGGFLIPLSNRVQYNTNRFLVSGADVTQLLKDQTITITEVVTPSSPLSYRVYLRNSTILNGVAIDVTVSSKGTTIDTTLAAAYIENTQPIYDSTPITSYVPTKEDFNSTSKSTANITTTLLSTYIPSLALKVKDISYTNTPQNPNVYSSSKDPVYTYYLNPVFEGIAGAAPSPYDCIRWDVTRVSTLGKDVFSITSNLSPLYQIVGTVTISAAPSGGTSTPVSPPPTSLCGPLFPYTASSQQQSPYATPLNFTVNGINTATNACTEVNTVPIQRNVIGQGSIACGRFDSRTIQYTSDGTFVSNGTTVNDDGSNWTGLAGTNVVNFTEGSSISLDVYLVSASQAVSGGSPVATGAGATTKLTKNSLCQLIGKMTNPLTQQIQGTLYTNAGNVPVFLKTLGDYQNFVVDAPYPIGQLPPEDFLPKAMPTEVGVFNTLNHPVTWTLSDSTGKVVASSSKPVPPFGNDTATSPAGVLGKTPYVLSTTVVATAGNSYPVYTVSAPVTFGGPTMAFTDTLCESGTPGTCNKMPMSVANSFVGPDDYVMMDLSLPNNSRCFVVSAPYPYGNNPVIFPDGGIGVLFINNNHFDITLKVIQEEGLERSYYDPTGNVAQFVVPAGAQMYKVGYGDTSYTVVPPSTQTNVYNNYVVETGELGALTQTTGSSWSTDPAGVLSQLFSGFLVSATNNSSAIHITINDVCTYVNVTTLCTAACSPACDGSARDTTVVSSTSASCMKPNSISVQRGSSTAASGTLVFLGPTDQAALNITMSTAAGTSTVLLSTLFEPNTRALLNGRLFVTSVVTYPKTVNLYVSCLFSVNVQLQSSCGGAGCNFRATVTTALTQGGAPSTVSLAAAASGVPTTMLSFYDLNDGFSVSPSYWSFAPSASSGVVRVQNLLTTKIGSAIDANGVLVLTSVSPFVVTVVCNAPPNPNPGGGGGDGGGGGGGDGGNGNTITAKKAKLSPLVITGIVIGSLVVVALLAFAFKTYVWDAAPTVPIGSKRLVPPTAPKRMNIMPSVTK